MPSKIRQGVNGVAHGDLPVIDQLLAMNLDALANSGLDELTYQLVRLAALIAISPIVGTARIASAAENVLRGYGSGDESQA